MSDIEPVTTSVVRRRWTSSVFGIVHEGRPRRRPSDIVRLVVAAALLAITSAGATDATQLEKAVADLFGSLPGGLESLWEILEALVPIVAGAMVVVALVRWRPRLLATQVVAIGSAAVVGGALSATVDAPDSLDYPVVVFAVAAAGLWASGPYLTRPGRRLLEAVFWLGALAALALGTGLPGSVGASMVLAWGAAALAHLCLGSPAATPSADQVADSLRDLGVDPSGLALAREQAWGATSFTAGAHAELSVEVVGRDSTDARLFAKLWRSIWYKDSGPRLSFTRKDQVEHQAYLLFLAARTGAQLPEVVAAGLAGWRDDALLVVRNPPGEPLTDVADDRLTDTVLDDAWANLRRLHDGRIAHGDPWAGNVVLVDDGTTALVGLADALSSAPDTRIGLDQVQLLATTAELVGDERALAAAQRALRQEDLVELLALLEPTALTGASKRHVTKPKARLKDLREAGAALTGVDPPKPTELHRFPASSVFLAAAFAFGVYLLVAQLAGVAAMGDIFSDAIWEWVLVTFFLAFLPQFSQAVAMLGAVSTRLPFGPVTGVQFANAFTGLVGGTAGNATLNIRFFQRQGLPPAVAVSSGVLTSATGFIVQAVLIVVAVVVTGPEFDFKIGGDEVPGWLAALGLVLVLGIAAVILVPSLRKRAHDLVANQVRSAWENVRGVLANPRKAVQLFGGNLTSQLFYAMVLGAALHAYGQSLPLLQLVLINCVASFVGGAAPVPGGMGVIETGLIAGFTASGIPEVDAVAATFTARLCTSYLPPIWGWFALSWLRKKEYV